MSHKKLLQNVSIFTKLFKFFRKTFLDISKEFHSANVLFFASFVPSKIIELTTYVPVVYMYMARDVTILMRAISITRAIGRGGP
jgi:hypothetical protein